MKKLRPMRRERKMSQSDLSELSGVSQTMIGAIERGVTNPTIGIVAKLANALDVSISELIGETNPGGDDQGETITHHVASR